MSLEAMPSKESLDFYQKVQNTPQDIDLLIKIENTVAGQPTYSPMLTKGEWLGEIKNNEIFFIKNEQGEVAGSIDLHKDGIKGTLDGLVVMSQFQGQGFAKRALEHTLNTILLDCTILNLFVHPNGPARKLYERLGFVMSQRLENYFGDGEPRLEMVLKR